MPSGRQREREREHVRIRWRKEEERERERKRNREEREREREEEEERVRKWGGETSSKAIDLDEGQDDESPYEVGDASEEEVVEVKKSVEPKKSASAAMLEMLSSESGSESSLEEESKGREGKRRCPPLGAILVD